MDYTKHLELVTNWGMYHNMRELMVGFGQLLAPVDQ